jgi:cystathionine gamma-synthase
METATPNAAEQIVEANEVKPETWVVIAGRPEPTPGAPLNTPVVAASTYVLGSERIYSRNEATAGWEAFEAMLGGLEGGDAVAFSSGMAACAAVFSQLPSGAHVVLVDDCYQGVAAIADAGARAHRWRVERLSANRPAVGAASLGGGSVVDRVTDKPAARGG